MTTPTLAAPPPQDGAFSSLRALYRRMVQAHPSIQDSETRRRAELLASMLIISFSLGIVLIGGLLAAFPSQLEASDIRAILLGMLTFPIYYLVVRGGRVTLAINLFIATTYMMLVLPSFLPGSGPTTLAFTAVVIFLSGVFLSTRVYQRTMMLVLVSIALLIFGSVALNLYPVIDSQVQYFSMWFLMILTAFLVSTFINNLRTIEGYRRQELESANAQLRESEASLERRVVERTTQVTEEREQAELLSRIAQGVNAATDYREIIQALASQVGALPFRINLNIYEHFQQAGAAYIETVAVLHAGEANAEADSTRRPIAADEPEHPALIVLDDVKHAAPAQQPIARFYAALGYQSVAAAQLIIRDEVLGSVQLLSESPYTFTKLERELLERASVLAASAVERIRLYKDQVRYAEELKEIDQIKGQFLASMSHELRTPLNSILNFSEFMNMELLGAVTDEQRDALDNITDSGKHLLSLINDVLDISKIQSGMLKLNVEPNIDLSSELQAVVRTSENLLQGKSVQLVVELPPDLPKAMCDKRRIRQVLLNLMSNAIKFTEEGSVTLHAERRGSEIWFSVRDTGPGVHQTDQSLLFQPFRQTAQGIKHAGGTGLGLAISKALIDAHGGQIWYEDNTPTGAAFFVRLPLEARISTPMISPTPIDTAAPPENMPS